MLPDLGIHQDSGGRRADQLTVADVEAYTRTRLAATEKRPAPATVNRELAVLRAALRWAAKRGDIPPWAVPPVQLLREPPGRVRVLSKDEERKLLAASGPRLRLVLLIALNTGMRRGEILGLRWRDVDLEHGFLRVERSAPGGEAGTKSGERRDVPLHPVARAALEPLLRRRRPTALLWQTRTGKPYQTAWRAFHGAAKRAKVSDVRLHDLRHTAASRLAMTGASLSDIAAILGHRDLRTTRRYVHLLRSHLRDRVMAIPAVPDDKPETEPPSASKKAR